MRPAYPADPRVATADQLPRGCHAVTAEDHRRHRRVAESGLPKIKRGCAPLRRDGASRAALWLEARVFGRAGLPSGQGELPRRLIPASP
jgi:hypothetical protein